MGKILVIGSSNTDLIANVDKFPAAGETVQGKFFMQAMGGKGANQALAARRLGGDVIFVTCLGNDANGKNALDQYRQEGLDVTLSRVVENVPTGTAMILVNGQGENCIVITPGANHELTPATIEGIRDEIEGASIMVLQMEIPFQTVQKACEFAARSGTRILLNVAPAIKIEASLLKLVDILVVNETEIEMISGLRISESGEEGVIDKLLTLGAKTIILTLGAKGCIIKSKEKKLRVPAFRVKPVDTTAAGDTFCGALAAQLSRGTDLVEAVKFATAAAAICVTRMGAQPSIPTLQEVQQFLNTTLTPKNE